MKRLGAIMSFLSLLMLDAACNDPASNVNRAVTSEAQKAASPQTAVRQKYRITPQNSKIEFIGSKVTGSHNGSFEKFDGEIHYTNNDPVQSHVVIKIDTTFRSEEHT